MKKAHVLYNPKAGNAEIFEKSLLKLKALLSDRETEYREVTQIKDYKEFFASISPEDDVYLVGGDGTLNHFVNDVRDVSYANDVYYFAAGTGNDFLNDVAKGSDDPVLINKYISDLPTVEVNGEEYRFINGVGYGIDGYCCEVGDALKERSSKPVNYTSIAIKGLLFHYKPTNATVTVDGKEYKYKKVWIAPVMNGRFYGGGMMPTPDQDRLDEEHRVSVCIMHGSGKLRTLTVFPSIFKGEHVKHEKIVAVHTGHSITVRFDRPTALQIDGETVKGVTEYHAQFGVPASVK
ncbi:MAG: diacylglycerol kinase family protein [Clostridia bacterium]|nr:diacylglycerol kinase family protein [Clostridia bacterium]